MVQTLAISKTMTTIAEVEEKFNLTPTNNDQFFTEWFQDLRDILPALPRSADSVGFSTNPASA